MTFLKDYPHSCRAPHIGRTNELKVHEIQYAPLKFHQEEIKKLQGTDPHYSELLKNMKMRIKTIKGNYSLDPPGVLYKKVQDHGKENNLGD